MQWNLIDSITLEKPSFGQQCNGCGICCIAKVCDLGVTLGDDRNCKALILLSDGSFQCGMVANSYRYMSQADLVTWKTIDALGGHAEGETGLKEMHTEMLGAGKGCDSDDEAVLEYLEEARAHQQQNLKFI